MTDKVHPFKRDPQSGHEADILGLHRMVPNIMTLTALAAGLTAMQLAFNEQWDRAALAIVIAAVLDAMDGATARLLKAQSDFGAQLDSLSDFLAFGIAPIMILYMWVLQDAGKIGWIALIVYAAAMALRLARYNVATGKPVAAWKKGFFQGVPAPAGAGLALLPLFIWLQAPVMFDEFAFANPLIGIWILIVAALMISRIPTWSTKILRLPSKMAMPLLGAAVLLMAALIQAPWQTLSLLSLAYLAHIPFAFRHFRQLQKLNSDSEDVTDLALGASAIDSLNEPSSPKEE